MILNLGFCGAFFCFLIFGPAWPIARRLPLTPIEKVSASVALSLLLVFLTAWLVYVCAWPLKVYWILPALAGAGVIPEWRTIISTAKESEVRTLLVAQLLITAWSLGLLALILTYSGGGWLADWWGHLERMMFFLDRGPTDILFNGFDPLTSRPPLANIVTGVFTQLTGRDFVHYQVFSTLFASLAFMPAALLARRFGGKIAIPVLTLFFMANPMFAENVTYSWTKLPAAFFILTALYFFLRATEHPAPLAAAVLFATSLAAGLLTHYSAGPYAIFLTAGWMVFGWHRRRDPCWRQATGFAVLSGTLVLASWFAWCFSVYGIRGTLMTNTSITAQAPDLSVQMQVVLLNIKDTLIPHFLRELDPRLIEQRSSIGHLRDWFFLLYQVNFIFAFGSAAFFAIAYSLGKQISRASRIESNFWGLFIIGTTLLGIAVPGGRDVWGLAHICLQPLVFAGLAFLAAQWPHLTHRWRMVLVAAATADFIAGIVLQFTVESLAVERWFPRGRSVLEIIGEYSQATGLNFGAKMYYHWAFLGDVAVNYGYAIVGFLTMIILCALRIANSPNQNRPTPAPS
jgi:hypothetical protein